MGGVFYMGKEKIYCRIKRFKDTTTPLPRQRAHGSAVPLKKFTLIKLVLCRLILKIILETAFLLLFHMVQNKWVAFSKQEIQQSMQTWYSNPIHSPSATSRRNRTQPCYNTFSFNALWVELSRILKQVKLMQPCCVWAQPYSWQVSLSDTEV